MLNSELLSWMRGTPSQINSGGTENEKNESANEYLSLPIVALVTEKETNETLEQHIPSENAEPDEFISESKDTVTTSSFQQNSLQIEDDTPITMPEEAVLLSDPGILQIEEDAAISIPEEEVTLPESVSLGIEEDTPPTMPEEEVLLSEPVVLQIEEDPILDKPSLTPEEEAATWKDYKGALFDELNKESAFDKSYGLEKKSKEQQYKSDTDVDVDQSIRAESLTLEQDVFSPEPEAVITPEADEYETSTSEYEAPRFYSHNKKMHAAALAEEYRKNKRIVSEQAGRMRKRRLIWLGIVLFLLVVSIVASVSYFSSAKSDSKVDPDLNKSVSGTDGNVGIVHSPDVGIPASDMISISPDVEGKYEVSEDIAVFVSEDINGAESDDLSLISEDISSEAGNQNAASSGEVKAVNASAPDINETLVAEDNNATIVTAGENKNTTIETEIIATEAEISATETKQTTNESKKTTIETNKKANETKNTTNASKKATITKPVATVEKAPAKAGSQTSPSVKSTGKELAGGVDLTKDKAYSAIKSKQYTDAISLSQGNLEKNPNDKFSFYSLGLALYATSNFSGATEAFFTCLRFSDPRLPDYMVEQFDSAENLKNLSANYPGVDLLIRAVDLNPKNKSLYINLFLSNLKSEKPRAASEIYSAVLNHAKKHSSDKS